VRRTIVISALASAAALAGDAPAREAYSAETLAMLDPTRLAGPMCGQDRSGEALRDRLKRAGRVKQGAATPPGHVPRVAVHESIRLAVTSTNPDVERFVRQGLLLAYGFNHGAAIDSFKAAQRLDPACAICFWGEAYALGPNINAPMTPEALPAARAALERAMARRANASPTERALIEALAGRYAGTDRAAPEAAYAEAMAAAAARFPADDDVALIAAEAAMNTQPWDYWEADGRTAKGRIGPAIALVETVLARSPSHPQAQHLYIHLMEASSRNRSAEAAADNLARSNLIMAGHLVHMPAHIYYGLGRFRDSIEANLAAARADEAYLAGAGENPVYRYGYYPHNVHFIVTSAQMGGRPDIAIEQADKLARIVRVEIAQQLGFMQPVVAAPFLTYAQFARPERILALPEADARLPYAVAMRHYARAVARAAQQDRAGFHAEIAALEAIGTGDAIQPMVAQGVPGRELIALAGQVARARWEAAAGRLEAALVHYRAAAELERRISYQEPPYWYYPVAQSIGATLHRLGRHEEARAAFIAALTRWPGNGWALYGLAATERALGHGPEAAAAEAAFGRAWLGDRAWLTMERL
jgi:tetratricopeptide (TPR) repeat protein